MKKNLFFMLLASMSMGFTACGSDDPEPNPDTQYEEVITIESLDYTTEYQKSWNTYMSQVAQLLNRDSRTLYNSWADDFVTPEKEYGMTFADIFKQHNGNGYESVVECLDEIVDGMVTIANEVGDSKIGGPADLWAAGKKSQAVLEVESWYSWHSIDDYTNNIRSIRNVYYGKYFGENEGASAQGNSIYRLMEKYYNIDNDIIVKDINNAIQAIQAIPAPFRNYIAAPQVALARAACAQLKTNLKNTLKVDLKRIAELHPEECDEVVKAVVDNVIVPTYADLRTKNQALLQAVNSFVAAPSNAGFTALANAWMASRRPWESSEAFLFGPVSVLQLDPNMDSWPLDQDGIERNIKAGNFDNINWVDSDNDDVIEAAQNLRGFHTLEFLIFKDGKARTIVTTPAK